MQTANKYHLRRLVLTAVLAAIVILMAFTPLGYLKIGPISVTFLVIPVAIGAIILGPLGGAVLGGIFGLTSFLQCFGMDALGTALLNINPIFMALVCFVPRILIGLFSGLFFRFLHARKAAACRPLSYFLSPLVGTLTNTVFFVGLLLLFFFKTDVIQQFGSDVGTILSVLITFNAAIETCVCTLAGGAIAKGLSVLIEKKKLF